ncbi:MULTISPECIES: type VII secretion integral membrane protein EccD [Streptomyces]|uniref:type VII secretion integral membrane protein EccD n=1 Tax=Streptomyces TaxID=1883 RepID=UPI0004C690B2|nr:MULTISPECIES: type VII secretion integral membrane protein EccD [Streptomyces]NNG86665.1 type VII secretion integral membrane protein EccD [Streptomyces cacaoi]QHF96667.1 type VII secretion integral membrane protein EccD [Streptomyces sp. NHF165]
MSTTASAAPAGSGRGPAGGSTAPGPVPAAVDTGFCRVTIVAPDSRIDVALPEDIPVADLYPEILRLSGQSPAEGAPVGYHLVRRDGTVLDSSRSFLAQRILDGEVLSLRPFADSLPPAVFDDVSDAVASAVTRDRALWNDGMMRAAGLIGGSVLLFLMAVVLWFSDPVRHDMHGLAGVLAGVTGVLLVALSAVRARVYGDRPTSVALGLAGLPHMLVAGSGLLPLEAGQGIGRLQFLLGCVAVLLASCVLVALTPQGDGPFVAGAFTSTVGTLITFIAIVTDIEPVETAAICAPVAVGLLAFLPGLSTRFARLPIGFETTRTTMTDYSDYTADPDVTPETQGPIDAERIAEQARRGHELLVGLVGGCAAVVAVSTAVLSLSGNGWGRLLALATGCAMLLRARLFRYASQVGCALIAGLVALVLLGVGLAGDFPADGGALRTVWLSAALAGAAILVTGIGLSVPERGVTPFWGRFLEILETFVLLTLVPLCLAVMDVYSAARSLTS